MHLHHQCIIDHRSRQRHPSCIVGHQQPAIRHRMSLNMQSAGRAALPRARCPQAAGTDRQPRATYPQMAGAALIVRRVRTADAWAVHGARHQ